MNKQIIIFLSLLAMCMSSYASTRYINYNDFIHFNEKQKIRTIELIHEYLIEYEKLEKYEQFEQKEKYQTYLKIIDLFIDSAYADGSPFSLSNNPGTLDLCYYGGWLSVTANDGTCKHPGSLRQYISIARDPDLQEAPPANINIIEKIYEKYSSIRNQGAHKITFSEEGASLNLEDTDNCSSTQDIMCNPSIYGLIDNNPICVAGNSQQGANSSLLCTQALNILKQSNPEKYRVTMNGVISQAQSENPDTRDEFFYTLRSMYDTCLCGSVSSTTDESGRATNNDHYFSRSINGAYASKMYNERTCFGIINQTQHIFEALGESTDNALCQQYIDTQVNGDTGLNWLTYLDSAYNVIQQQGINDTIQAITTDISGNRLTREQADELLQGDRNSFAEMRRGHFDTYISENLCPLGNDEFRLTNDEVDRQLVIGLVNTDANTTGEFAMVTVTYTENGSDKSIEFNEQISLAALGTVSASLENQATGEEIIYQATRQDGDYRVQATLTVDGNAITSNELVIPAIVVLEPSNEDEPVNNDDENSNQLVIALVNTDANTTGEFALVTVTYTEEGTDKSVEFNQQISLAAIAPATAALTNQTSAGDETIKYQAPRQESNYQVQASLTVNDTTITSNQLVIPALANTQESDEDDGVDDSDQANCEVKLRLNPGENGRFALAVVIKAPDAEGVMTTYPDDDNQMPQGLSLTWHDSVNSSGRTSPSISTPQSRNMIADDEEEANDNNEQNELVTRIEDSIPRSSQYNVGEDEDPYSTISFTQIPTERTIGVVMKIGSSCEAGDVINIPGRNNQRTRPVNNSPPKFNRPQIRQALPGMILRGQR